LDHRLRLERDQSIDAFEADPARLEGIARSLYSSLLGNGKRARSGRRLLRDYEAKREKIRACYERHFLGTSKFQHERI
jgi:hypothetical protein